MAGEASITIGIGVVFDKNLDEDTRYEVARLFQSPYLRDGEVYNCNTGESTLYFTVSRLRVSGDPQDGDFKLGFQKLPAIDDLTQEEFEALAEIINSDYEVSEIQPIVVVDADC